MEHFLVAMDATPGSLDCIRYFCSVMRGVGDVKLTLFHVLPTASPNLLKREEIQRIELAQQERPELSGYFWTFGDQEKMNRVFGEAKRLLMEAGFEEARISTRFTIQSGDVAQLILTEARNFKCSTIIMGRKKQGLVKELLLGSVSLSVLKQARFATVWVVAEK